ncbi:MAG: PQQ-binding-like beta-propeller repeat protein [Acidobacteria bacterium]|nr:PQQ-binding-like beta-propeller repeat protein [Acidobacteriota bacterium]
MGSQVRRWLGLAVLPGLLLLGAVPVVNAQWHGSSPPEKQGATVYRPVAFAVTPPLRTIKPLPVAKKIRLMPEHELPEGINMPPNAVKGGGAPPSKLHYTDQTTPGTRLMPAPILNFEGGGDGLSGYTIASEPPDTEGDVGLNYYVQWTNTMFTIFNKSDASVAYGPAAGNTLWSSLGSGNECADDNDGDPIVEYDQMANRWIMTQFAVSQTDDKTNYYQCIAVSQTSDPTGSWYLYEYTFSDFNDYPKMGVWPDGYYITYNMFANGQTWDGGEICAYDRTAMINGDANAVTQCFGPYSSYGGLLPADMEGPNEPPSGSPEYVVAKGGDGQSLLFWKLHIDWSNSSNSTFTGPTTLTVASFSEACSGGTCIAQPGVTQQLDSLADRMMYRLAYRNFPGDHESLVVNHSVTGSSADSAIRWYEIRDPGGTPTIYQSGTYEPDGTSRWMGSIAMDHMGNMALGYSASSSSVYPSIYYTGRLAGDTLNEMTQAESSIVDGTGSQDGHSRWGDYSSMSIDPSDDCTFWYTQEYYTATGDFQWHTRIASFKYSDCAVCTDPGQPVITSITDNSACAQDGVHVNYTAGSGATSHDLYVDGALAVSNYASGDLYNPGDTNSHSYVIRALDDTCYTDSAAQSFTDADDSPATPAAPSVSDDDQCAQTGVTVSWTSVTGATAYDLLIDGTTTITNVSSPYSYNPGDSASHTYQVRGTNSTCTGAWSAATSASDADAFPATPSAPSVSDISVCAASGIGVSWSAAANATSYNVARDGTTVATGVTATSYTDTPGDAATHTYTVQAVNDNCSNTSAWSAGTSGADADHSFAFGGIQTATDRDACDDTGVVLTWNTPATWNDGGSGTRSFSVLRGGSAIASDVSETTTSYVDTTGTNGTTYSYGIQATNGYGCATDGGTTASAVDNVGAPPTFDGLQSVTVMAGSTCGLKLEWNAATSNCATGTSIVYNIYRSTTSGFTPDSSTLMASCVTNLYYEDTTVAGGTTYYYIVRAEDSSVGHGGACNGGFEDANTIEKSGVAGNTTWTEDFESGSTGWTASGGLWHEVNSTGCVSPPATSGTHAWYYGQDSSCDYDTGATTTGTLTSPTISGVTSSSLLSFEYWRQVESYSSGGYDITKVDVSYDGGTTWNQVWYKDCADASGAAWTASGDIALSPPSSPSDMIIRFTFDSVDSYYNTYVGWLIDDVSVTNLSGSTCSSGTSDPLQSFTARATSGQVTLEWVNPSTGVYGSTKICRDTSAYPDESTCTPIVSQAGSLGAYDSYTDTGLTNGTTYYYTAFVDDGAGNFSSAKTVTARPFDTSGKVKWVYNSEATALAPNGVYPGAIGTGATWAVSNDRVLHGMNPGDSGGTWPRTGSYSWKPMAMNGPAEARPPVVPTSVVSGASMVVFLGSEDGHVYAVNAETGVTLWQSAQLSNILLASPAGMFTDFGGSWSVLFAGSRDATADNAMYMLDPSDGSTITSFNNGGGSNGIGIISSAASVDYASNRLYFASRESSTGGSKDTLWCLSFDGTSLTKVWSVALGDIDGAPILYGGRIYVGNNSGIVYAIDPADGHTIWSYATDDGPVKGYVIPQFTQSTPRRLYFSTTNDIWAITDDGSSASLGWKQTSVASPSIPLHVFGADPTYLYAGSSDGKLYQLSAADGSVVTSVTLGDGSATIGSPAYDHVNSTLYVGSESGAVYGVQVPLQ